MKKLVTTEPSYKEHAESFAFRLTKNHLAYFMYFVLSIVPAVFLFNSTLTTGEPFLLTNDPARIVEYVELWTGDKFGTTNSARLWILFPVGIVYLLLSQLFSLSGQMLQFVFVSTCFFVGFSGFHRLMRQFFNKPNLFATILASVFFMYNMAVARLLGGHYEFLLSYALIPFFLTAFIQYVTARKLQYGVLAAVLLAFIFGPNLVFGFVALLGATIYLLYSALITHQKKTKGILQLAVVFLMTLPLIAWWLVPSMSSIVFESNRVSYVLQSEDFYNYDTGVSNVLRILGDWSFFSAHKGVPYVEYAHSFKDNAAIVFASFVPLLLLGWALTTKRTPNNKQVLFAAMLFVPVAFIVGGTNPEWITSSVIATLFSNFPTLQIFRNTYKFIVLLVLAYGVCVYLFARYLSASKSRPISKLLFALLVLLPAFPIFLNSSRSNSSLVDVFPSYWTDSAEVLNNKYDISKALLLPDQYFSVFEWNGEFKSLGSSFESSVYDFPVIQNTCAGCGNGSSREHIGDLAVGFDQDSYAKLLQLSGISHIIQRNDYDASFYGVKNIEAIDPILQATGGINQIEVFGELAVYEVENPYEQVYSPEQLIVNASGEKYSVLQNVPSDARVGIIDNEQSIANLQGVPASTFDSVFYDTSTVTVSDAQVSETFTGSADASSSKIYLDDPTYALNNPGTGVLIGSEAGSEQITFDAPSIKYEPSPITDNTSYILGEDLIDAPTGLDRRVDAGNCRRVTSDSVVEAAVVGSSDDNAVQLSANADLGCYTLKPRNLERDKQYLLWFDYRVLEGGYFGYCVSFDGGSCKHKEFLIADSGTWQRHYVAFSTNNEEVFERSKIFLYAPAVAAKGQSTVEYRNVEAHEVIQAPTVLVDELDASTTYTASFNYALNEQDLIPDADFRTDTWGGEDRSCGLVLDNSEYETVASVGSLTLRSFNTLACSASEPFTLESNASYVLEIDAEVIDGDSYGYCIFINGSCSVKDFVYPESSNRLAHRSLVKLRNQTQSKASLFLYSAEDARRNPSQVRFYGASLKQLTTQDLPRLSVVGDSAESISQLQIQNVIDSGRSEYTISASAVSDTAVASLAFLDSYSSAWRMTVNGVTIDDTKHFVINSFANGWIIDMGSVCAAAPCATADDGSVPLEIILRYGPQSTILPAMAVSAATYSVMGAFLIVRFRIHENIFHIVRIVFRRSQ